MLDARSLEILRNLHSLAEEAVDCREADPEEEDTEEIIAMHRETLEQARQIIDELEAK